MTMRILRGVAWLVLGGVLLVAAAYGALLLVNLSDRPLPSEAQAFADAATLNVPPEQNGFFALLGIRAPAAENPHQAGHQAFERFAAAARAGVVDDNAVVADLPRVDEKAVCEQRQPNCLEKVAANRRGIEESLTRHATLLARIHELARYPRFHAPRLPHHPSVGIPIGEFSGAWKLGATATAHAWLSGRRAASLELSAARVAVARRMLRDSGDLLHTALAAAWLRSEFLLLSEILQRDPDGARAHIGNFERLLQPLAADELHATRWVHGEYVTYLEICRAFPNYEAQRRQILGELLLSDRMIETDFYTKNFPAWIGPAVALLAPLFQPEATAGALLPTYAEVWITEARAPAHATAARRHTEPTTPATGWSLYNPVGVAYVRNRQRTGILGYTKRLHDLDRIVRLVAVQAALVKARVVSRDVDAFVAALPAGIDPATGKPMHWDSTRSQLWIDALSSDWERVYGGAIGGVPGRISVRY